MRGISWLLVGALSVILGPDLRAEEVARSQEAPRSIKFEIEIGEPGGNPAVLERQVVILGPAGIRLDDEVDEAGSPMSSMVYRRESESFLILIHDAEEAVAYDLEEFQRYSERNEALQEKLWERLAMGRSPEEAEALLKSRDLRREAAQLGNDTQKAGSKIDKTDVTGEMDGHPWTKYQEFRSGILAREFLVTPWEHLGIEENTSRVFDETTIFAEKKQEISGGPMRAPYPFQYYDQFDGFPLVMRQFDASGSVVLESKVTAIETIESSEAVFQNPGYPEKGLADTVRVIE